VRKSCSYQYGWYFGEYRALSDTLLLRYDIPHGRVLARSPNTGIERDFTCDLSQDFGAEVWCGAGSVHASRARFDGGYLSREGAVVVEGDTVAVAAIKGSFATGGGGLKLYYHGLGLITTWGDDVHSGSITLSYLRINGVEYGAPAVFLSTEHAPERALPRLEVYPSPARELLWIDVGQVYMISTAAVYDSYGRLQLQYSDCESLCRLNVSTLPAGVYMLHVKLYAAASVTRSFVIVR